MKILFLTRKQDGFGGVQKHVNKITDELIKKGHSVKIISESNIKYPRVKVLGLLYIWLWLFRNRKVISNADIVHCHDVFIWYFPFRFIYPGKKVYTTFHGWEGKWPIPLQNIIIKKISAKLSNGSFAVGKYIEKYYGIKTDKIIYGATSTKQSIKYKKIKNKVVFVGRLEKDTGVLKYLRRLDEYETWDAEFVGDGPLKKECLKYGKVHGFTDPAPYYKKADYVIPAGYLSYIEAKSFGCKIITYPDNPLKKDYWKDIKKINKFPAWEELAGWYIKLWNG